MQSSDSNSLDNSNDTKNSINIIKKDDDEYINEYIIKYNKENLNTEDDNYKNSNEKNTDCKKDNTINEIHLISTNEKTLATDLHLPASVVSQLSILLNAYLKEQKVARRWRILFRYTALILMLIALCIYLLKNVSDSDINEPHVALIKLEGAIEYGSPAAAEPIIAALQAAFEDTASVAVVLQMNSPGGSPVQADMINAEIMRLKSQYKNKLIYSVIEEVCASGCYYIAAATSSIYANSSSMVGSIGVVMDSFGAVDLIKKLGIERRIYTAGINKSLLDPFTPSTEKQKSIINSMLNDVHSQFITAVKEGRGKKLKDDGELFSGRVYSGNQALTVGLIDDIATMGEIMRDIIGNDNVIDYSPKENLAERVAKKFGASLGIHISNSMNNIFKLK
jgi:protease IV